MPYINKVPPTRKNKRTPNKFIFDSHKYYNSKRWRQLRRYKMENNPLCECCLEKGIVTPAEHVHHIIPFSRGETDNQCWNLLLSYNNLKSVCTKCHYELHKELNKDKHTH